MNLSQNDILWLFLCAFMVFIMQAGFLCLETGLTRSKNNINVAVKNIADFALSSIVFWLVGYGLMFGATRSGFVGVDTFAPQFEGADAPSLFAFLSFQIMFCGTAVTIVSGAVAERMRFGAYLILAAIVSGLVYPIFGHWAWNGVTEGVRTGWLAGIGFYDFAGASVVHGLGGWAALATLMIVGPRQDRYDKDGRPHQFDGSYVPLATVGLLLLYLGWFGFNGGSSFRFDELVPTILVNTLLAGSSGMLAGMLVSRMRTGRVTVSSVINSCLAGLVSVTAGANAVSPTAAVLIGALGGMFAIATQVILERSQIDDAVGAVPVHLAGALWGILAVGIFGDPAIMNTGLSLQQQIGAQLVGIAVNGLWAFGATWVVLTLIQFVYELRVTPEQERLGLNVSEHLASSDLTRFVQILDRQVETGDLSLRAPVNHFSELGRVSEGYNQVMDTLEQTTDRSKTIIDSARDGIIMFSQDTLELMTINPAAQQMFGVSAESSLYRPITELLNTSTIGSPVPLFRHISTTGRPYPFIGRRGSGAEFPLELSLSATYVDQHPVYISTIRDISERVEQQGKLEQLNADLIKSNHYKDAFLASMSHELRTPLNAILGMSEALESDVYGSLNDPQRGATTHIRTSGRHLLDLIDEILDLSKISTGGQKLDKHILSIRELCEASVSLVRQHAENKDIELKIKYEGEITTMPGDPRRLKQVLVNLLNNAVKFTEPGGKVGLMVVPAPSKGIVHFVVWDNGIGIPEADIHTIFQPFVQGDDGMDRRYGGAGLGLAIVERLVDLHDGSIRVSSEVGKGSRFVVTLPWTAEEPVRMNGNGSTITHSTAQLNGNRPQNLMVGVDETVVSTREEVEMVSADYSPPSILLAEDNEANIVTLSDYLAMHGYQLHIARNGLEALEGIAKHNPNIVLMDIQMPKMDGLTAIEKLRETHSLIDLPVIALTAFAMPGDRERCLNAGANDYLSKPISLKQLVQKIQLLLSSRDEAISGYDDTIDATQISA